MPVNPMSTEDMVKRALASGNPDAIMIAVNAARQSGNAPLAEPSEDRTGSESILGRFKNWIAGTPHTIETRQGPVNYREGGIPGWLAGGRPVRIPGIGIAAPSGQSLDEVTAIHEKAHEGRGAGYDLVQALKGNITPVGEESTFWRPSEIWATTSQPVALSTGEGSDVSRLGTDILNKPDLLDIYLKNRNPESDWPTTREGFRALGLKTQEEANAEQLARALAAQAGVK